MGGGASGAGVAGFPVWLYVRIPTGFLVEGFFWVDEHEMFGWSYGS